MPMTIGRVYVTATYARRGGHVRHSREAQVLRLVAEVCGLLDISEFRYGLLDALNRALPSSACP